MNKISKFASTLLVTSLIASPISGVFYQNNNFAKAENIEINKSLNQKEIEEAYIISQHVKLTKKNNIYQFRVINDNLDNNLKNINSKLTSKEIKEFYNQLNILLKQENSNGQITDAILQIKYENSKLSNKQFRGCSFWYGLAGLGTSSAYGALAVALEASGPAGWALLGAGTLVGAGFLAAAEGC